jgi:hypothetical protein
MLDRPELAVEHVFAVHNRINESRDSAAFPITAISRQRKRAFNA